MMNTISQTPLETALRWFKSRRESGAVKMWVRAWWETLYLHADQERLMLRCLDEHEAKSIKHILIAHLSYEKRN